MEQCKSKKINLKSHAKTHKHERKNKRNTRTLDIRGGIGEGRKVRKEEQEREGEGKARWASTPSKDSLSIVMECHQTPLGNSILPRGTKYPKMDESCLESLPPAFH